MGPQKEIAKSSRAPNFTLGEKNRLLNVIANKYKHIVEDKKTDRTSLQDKNKAWDKIASDFNSSSPNNIYRSASSLRKFYDNKKKEVRKQVAEERKQSMLTGGGPPPKIPKDENYDIMLSIINQKTVNGLSNPYDDDASTDNIPVPESEDEFVFEINREETQENNSETCGKNYTPSELMSISAPSRTPKSRVTNNVGEQSRCHTRQAVNTVRALSSSAIAEKYDMLMDKRLSLANLQIEQLKNNERRAEEEHKLKIEFLQLELQKIKQEIELNKTKTKLIMS